MNQLLNTTLVLQIMVSILLIIWLADMLITKRIRDSYRRGRNDASEEMAEQLGEVLEKFLDDHKEAELPKEAQQAVELGKVAEACAAEVLGGTKPHKLSKAETGKIEALFHERTGKYLRCIQANEGGQMHAEMSDNPFPAEKVKRAPRKPRTPKLEQTALPAETESKSVQRRKAIQKNETPTV